MAGFYLQNLGNKLLSFYYSASFIRLVFSDGDPRASSLYNSDIIFPYRNVGLHLKHMQRLEGLVAHK